MKRVLIGIVALLAVAGTGIYAFREPLLAAAMDRMTANMFVAKDTDSYDPGVAVGQVFPAIRARYQDRVVTGIGELMDADGVFAYAQELLR